MLFTTLILATVCVLIATCLLGIGWLITGKAKICGGTCGRDPTKKKDKTCETDQSCPLCHKSEDDGKR